MNMFSIPVFKRAIQIGRWLCLHLTIALHLASCAEDESPDSRKKQFTSIFDRNEYNARFAPLDVVQTGDEGYLVLGERKVPGTTWSGIYILKADAHGNFQGELLPEQHYVNPVGGWMPHNGGFAFVAMDTGSQGAVIVEVDADAQLLSITPLSGFTYPAAASADGDGILLLSYNHADRTTVISRHDFSGTTLLGPRSFSIGAGDEVEEPIMEHFLRTGKRFPFQVGKASGAYYFNGFINYTFSLVFTDLQADQPMGIVYGQQDDGGFSAIHPVEGNTFALARFNFGDNYLLPKAELQLNNVVSAVNLGGFTFPEMTPDATVKILNTRIDEREVLIYATNTRSKQVGLFFYDRTDGAFLSSRYLGFSNPYEVGALSVTRDGGLIIGATTWLAGRFPRICLLKLPPEDLRKHAK